MKEYIESHPLLKTIMENPSSSKQAVQQFPEPYLVILSGADQGKRIRLDRQLNVFGRDRNVQIMISDPKISRQHGAFIIYPDGILLEDYQSTNGTFVDNIRITKQNLNQISRIRVGNTHMKIDYKKPSEAEFEEAQYNAANTDLLTQISNRRSFLDRAQEEISFSNRNHTTLSIVMCDVDHFKNKNDTYGHCAGDIVLKELAEIFSEELRKEDLLARYGGEEFIMLLRNTDEEAAYNLTERIRLAVENHVFLYQGKSILSTISIGVCTRKGDQIVNLEQLIQIADDALYKAKINGRNRIEQA